MGRVNEEAYTAGVAAVGEKGMGARLRRRRRDGGGAHDEHVRGGGVVPRRRQPEGAVGVRPDLRAAGAQTESMKKMERAASTIFY